MLMMCSTKALRRVSVFLLGMATATENRVRASTKITKYLAGPSSYPLPMSAIHISLFARGSFFFPKTCRFVFLSFVVLHTMHAVTMRFRVVISPGK